LCERGKLLSAKTVVLKNSKKRKGIHGNTIEKGQKTQKRHDGANTLTA